MDCVCVGGGGGGMEMEKGAVSIQQFPKKT